MNDQHTDSHTRLPVPRRQLWQWVGLGIVLGAAIAWGIMQSTRQTDHAATSVTSANTRSTMSGMAGMNMTTGGTVTLSAAQLRQFGVTFGTVDVRPLTAALRVPGVVAVDERRMSQVTPKISGYVERLYVNATGQPVRRGQPLAEIYAPDLLAAQQELLVSRQLQHDIGTSTIPGTPAGSANLVEAAKERLRLWDISDAQIADILRSGHARRTMTLAAPASGIVLEKSVVQGQAITPGVSLYTIADLSTVWVTLDVREADASSVRVGSAATVELTGYPGRPLVGRVDYIYPTVQQDARTLKGRVIVANPDGRLKPGMYAVVHLTTSQSSALTIPTSALLRTGERNIVFVDMGHGSLMPHDVEMGRSAGAYTEILAGLEPGQRVVTSAQFLLDSESNLADVMKAMMSQMGTGDKGMNDMQNMPGMSGMDMPGMSMPATPSAQTPSSHR
jgi:Cu(I)/Ag(I) efflux system membrane fusion protein